MRFFLYIFFLSVISIFSFSFILEYKLKNEIKIYEDLYNSKFIYESFQYDIINNNVKFFNVKFLGFDYDKIVISNVFYKTTNHGLDIKNVKISVYQVLNFLKSSDPNLFNYLNSLSNNGYFYLNIKSNYDKKFFIYDLTINDLFQTGLKLELNNYDPQDYLNIDFNNINKDNAIEILNNFKKINLNYLNFYIETNGLFTKQHDFIINNFFTNTHPTTDELDEILKNIFVCVRTKKDLFIEIEINKKTNLFEYFYQNKKIDFDIYSSIK